VNKDSQKFLYPFFLQIIIGAQMSTHRETEP